MKVIKQIPYRKVKPFTEFKNVEAMKKNDLRFNEIDHKCSLFLTHSHAYWLARALSLSIAGKKVFFLFSSFFLVFVSVLFFLLLFFEIEKKTVCSV